jgi:Fic family protein
VGQRFINDDAASDLDPLVKMAIIHHQFESIHPFSDGNGRIGRIINVLYLTRAGLLEIPILYLSRYVTTHKADYYRLLQAVRDDGAWEPWLLSCGRSRRHRSRRSSCSRGCAG